MLIILFPFVSTDIIDKSELKVFFESNCSQIYFIFYENFITLESNLKQKGEYNPFNYVQVFTSHKTMSTNPLGARSTGNKSWENGLYNNNYYY